MQQSMHKLPDEAGALATSSHHEEKQGTADAQIALLSEIISGMAHDMGTPLNVISGYAESMLMALPEDAQVRRQASAIVDQTRRVANMIHQMLDVVRPAPGHTSSGKPLDRFAGDIHQISGHMLRQQKVRSQFDACGPHGIVSGDLPTLAQALFGVFRSAAQVVGPKGQFAVRTVSDDATGTGITIEGTGADGLAANLASLAEPGLGLRDPQHAGLALAERALVASGGGLEPLQAADGTAGAGLFVRIGAPDVGTAREVRAGGEASG
jgi:signal transduction histidine kinase